MEPIWRKKKEYKNCAFVWKLLYRGIWTKKASSLLLPHPHDELHRPKHSDGSRRHSQQIRFLKRSICSEKQTQQTIYCHRRRRRRFSNWKKRPPLVCHRRRRRHRSWRSRRLQNPTAKKCAAFFSLLFFFGFFFSFFNFTFIFKIFCFWKSLLHS